MTIQNYIIPAITSTPVAIVMGAFCAVPAVEIALSALENLRKLFEGNPTDELANPEMRLRRTESRNALAENALVSLCLGVCAANLFPGSAVVGALGFVQYSKARSAAPCNQKNVTIHSTVVASILLKEFAPLMVKKIPAFTSAIISKISKIFHTVTLFFKKGSIALLKFPGKCIIAIFNGLAKAGSATIKIARVCIKLFVSLAKHPVLAIGALATLVLILSGPSIAA